MYAPTIIDVGINAKQSIIVIMTMISIIIIILVQKLVLIIVITSIVTNDLIITSYTDCTMVCMERERHN